MEILKHENTRLAGIRPSAIEISQDITEIQKLEGEQRLLDWDNQ